MKNKKVIISWIMVILWMTLIFYFSSQVRDESNQLSTGITVIISRIIEKINIFDFKIDIKTLNHIVRKLAHFSIYFILGILIINAIRKSKYISLIICILYAITDEIHQSFVPGRGPSIKDVMIDSFGALIGILLFSYISNRFTKNIVKRE